MERLLKTTKGQSLLESLIVLPLLLGLFSWGLHAAHLAWIQLSLEQTTYECAMCLVQQSKTAQCLKDTSARLNTRAMGSAKVRDLGQRGPLYFCEVWLKEGQSWKKIRIHLDKEKIKKASRSFFWRP